MMRRAIAVLPLVLASLGCTGVMGADEAPPARGPAVDEVAPEPEADEDDPDDGSDQDTEPEDAWHPPAQGEVDELGRPAPTRPAAPPPAADIETGRAGQGR